MRRCSNRTCILGAVFFWFFAHGSLANPPTKAHAHSLINSVACDSSVVRGPHRSIQVNVDAFGCNVLGDAANEPSIAIDPTDRRKIVIGWRQFDTIDTKLRQAGVAYSHDAGHTWVSDVLAPGRFRSDPVLDAGPRGTIYYFGISLDESLPPTLFRSFDGG